MPKSQESEEYRQLADATNALKEAEKRYHDKIMEFVSVAPPTPGKPVAPPNRVLDAKGMKEIDEAEADKDKANEAFKNALNVYYAAKHSF
jgi:hypothetical protein